MKKPLSLLLVAFLLGLSGCSGVASLGEDVEDSDLEIAEVVPSASDPEPDFTPDPDISLSQEGEASPHSSLPDVIEEVLPSVVNVRVSGIEGRGEGSGVIIDPKGIILTNNHVVAGATEVTIVFNDGRETAEGRVVGTEADQDLAVVKVEEETLPAIELGNSKTLRLGDDVVALGFPLGLGGLTVTKGIVSAINRTIDVGAGTGGVPATLRDLLQTDAAINPGNSGGALIDLDGRLIGINTAAAQAGSAENIGFAIPIDRALPVARAILDDPDDQRAWLGVSIQSVDSAAIAGQLGLATDVRGALIVEFLGESAAQKAGAEEGDVIIRIDDTPIASGSDLSDTLLRYDPEDVIELEVIRDGEPQVFEVTLALRPPGLD